MENISVGSLRIEEFAKMQGVTDRAIRKHLQKYAAELEGHVFPDPNKRGTLLDPTAQEIITKKMNVTPVVWNGEKEIELLRENKALHEELREIEGEKYRLELAAIQHKALEAAHEDLKQKLQDSEDRAYNAELEADTQSQAAAEAQKRASEAEEKAAQAEADLVATVNQNEKLQAELQEAQAELEELRSQGLFQRIFRKKVKRNEDREISAE